MYFSILMELTLNGIDLKFEDDKLFRRRVKCSRGEIKVPIWKQCVLKPNKQGYTTINLNGKTYLIHRIIYKLHNPDWDITDTSSDNEIDQINGTSPKNNHISNLRILTHAENIQNNSHWAKGYHFSKANNKFIAQIRYDGNYKYLGGYDTAEEAREQYLNAKAELHKY